MTGSQSEYSARELGRAVERIELDLREIKGDVKGMGQTYVTRQEFEAWRAGSDREFRDLKDTLTSGIAELRDDIKRSTPAWWVIAALGVSGLGFIFTLIQAYA